MAIARWLACFVAGLIVLPFAGCGRIDFATQPLGNDGPLGDGSHLDSRAGCDLAADFGAPVLLVGVSTAANSEATLRLLPDELTGYLWSSRSGNIDLAKVTRASLGETFAYQSFDELNTGAIEFEPTISSDDSLLVFRSNRASGAGNGDLYVADRIVVGGPMVLRGELLEVSTANDEKQPFLTDSELLFVSDRSGAERIYRSPRVIRNFLPAIELAEIAMTGASDTDPVMTADRKTIYWGSTRPGGMGDIDIWTAHRSDASAQFAAPALVANVNSAMTDAPSWISIDQCRLYMSSNRAGTPDVYVATRP